MAKAKSKSTETPDTETISADDPSIQMAKYLNRTKADHYNLDTPIAPIQIPTGSLALDLELGSFGGGFGGGAHRISGSAQTGKTPFLLGVLDNMLDLVPNSRAIWVKSEGRMSERNLARVRHPVVYTAEEWKTGTIFVFKCNTFETVIDMLRDFVLDNPTGTRYGVVIDSVDNMILRNDRLKKTDEGVKVAGGPKLTKELFQRIGMALNERGHYAWFIGQVSADIKLDPYAKGQPRQMNGGGGNSLAHNANEALEFQEWYEGDLILQNPNERHHRLNNPALGHVIKVKLKKSDSEKRYVTVEIPIKYGVTGKSAIWREREIGDLMLGWGLVTKAGSWLTLTPTLLAELAQHDIKDLPDKVQGLNQLYALLEERRDVADYLFESFKARLSSGGGK